MVSFIPSFEPSSTSAFETSSDNFTVPVHEALEARSQFGSLVKRGVLLWKGVSLLDPNTTLDSIGLKSHYMIFQHKEFDSEVEIPQIDRFSSFTSTLKTKVPIYKRIGNLKVNLLNLKSSTLGVRLNPRMLHVMLQDSRLYENTLMGDHEIEDGSLLKLIVGPTSGFQVDFQNDN